MKCYSSFKTPSGRPVSCTDVAAGSSIASDEAQWTGGSAIPTGLGKTQYLTFAADVIFHF